MRPMRILPTLILIPIVMIGAPQALADDGPNIRPPAGERIRQAPRLQPRIPGVFVEEIPAGVRAIEQADTSTAAFVGAASAGPVDEPVLVTSFAEFTQQFGGLDPARPLGYAVRLFFANDGVRAWVVRTDPDGLPGDAAAATGIHALDAADPLSILCIPEVSDPAVLTAAERYARERRAVLLIDPPAGADSPSAVMGWLTGPGGPPRTPNCASYFPWLEVPEAEGSATLRNCGPSGAVAGIFARTDAARGVWKAPAGTAADLRGVASLTRALTNADSASLNPLGINPLRDVAGRGMLVWGARTLSDDPEWRYVPVRRTALMIEESVLAGTRWVASEPNEPPTWAQVRAQVEAFLHDLWRRGALQGTATSEAYFVRCDATTTTSVDVAAGRMNILVGVAMTRPAEFVVLRITQKAETD